MSKVSKNKISALRRRSLRLGVTRNEISATSRFVATDFESLNTENSDPGLAQTSWRAFRVTPLRNLSYNKQFLKNCSEKLSAYIEKELKKNQGVLISQTTTFKTKFSILLGVATPNDDEAVKIEVFSKDHEKAVATAVLLSVEREAESWEAKWDRQKFTFLPLLLVKGSAKMEECIIGFLKDSFDCVIHPLVFTHVQMMWMAAMWAGSKSSSGSSSCFLEYHTGLEKLKIIQYSIDAESISKIWSCAHDPKSNEMTADEVDTFFKCVEEHFKKIFSIDLSYFHLHTIGTTAAAVRKNGSVKVMCPEAVGFVLRHLTALAQEVVLT